MQPEETFATRLAQACLSQHTDFEADAHSSASLLAHNRNQEILRLNLLPFRAKPQPVTAAAFFTGIHTTGELLQAYRKARESLPFEEDVPGAMDHVSGYAGEFMSHLLEEAKKNISDAQAAAIAAWVAELDVYCAVKSCESLFYSRPDLVLLEIAQEKQWRLHFDHLAIRCGSAERGDAERIAGLLRRHHGYSRPQIPEEAFYQFPDGWNAYPLYKILENGQVLRCFIDQSDGTCGKQIIQHWNYIYGYTAHHLAIRATRGSGPARQAVPLEALMEALQTQGVEVMTPTGQYTEGLLQQVFTRPQRHEVPQALLERLGEVDPDLPHIIGNGKLLELVSRKECPVDLQAAYFSVYGLEYGPENALHSAPCYQYFLPAQAAHVIRTSVQ